MAGTPDYDEIATAIAELLKNSLALTTKCVELQTQLPHNFKAALDTAVAAELKDAVAAALAGDWIEVDARTPTALEAAHPLGEGDDQVYHVVLIGREPGLYSSVKMSDYQVNRIPSGKRHRKVGRAEALAFYRRKFNEGEVRKMMPVEEYEALEAASQPSVGRVV
ncbi:hypothetical protein R3P38DRAFT_2815727 [Favolaschia claudopus]|uniref:Uncharacterized protein n=1 Tax=Favolaschia claudopus TaxID=2862362 RepID=A0AAV9Z126_9AGAR